MTTGAIVFARMSSSRLPGKALIDIAGRSLIGRVIDRTKAIGLAGPTVVATSTASVDDVLADVARAEGAAVFRGDLDDVAGRALAAARANGLSAFARICGDRPFFDPAIVRKLAGWQQEDDLDLATNAAVKTFPAGLTAEVVGTEALARGLREASASSDREHVTTVFYGRSEAFRIRNLQAQPALNTTLSLVVDTQDDLDRARFIARGLGQADGPGAPITLILSLAAAWYAGQNANAQRGGHPT